MEEKKFENKAAWWQPAVALFLKLSGLIVGPVLVASFLGKYLDKRYNSEPWFFLICIGISFIFSMIILVVTTMKEFKNIEKGENGDKDEFKNNNDLKTKS